MHSGLCESKAAARRTVGEGGAYVNNVRIPDEQWRATSEDLLPGGWLVIRRGKRSVGGIQISVTGSA